MSTTSQNMPKEITARLPRYARPLGAVIVLTAILVLFIGMSLSNCFSQHAEVFGKGITRYFRIQSLLIQGKFPPSRHLVIVISALLAVLVSIIFGILAGVTH